MKMRTVEAIARLLLLFSKRSHDRLREIQQVLKKKSIFGNNSLAKLSC